MPEIDYENLEFRSARPYPAGPTVFEHGIRFNVFSRHATRVWLAFFAHHEDVEPAFEYEFDPVWNRVGEMWSVFVAGLQPDCYYMYRMDGPWVPEDGHRFDASKYLLDPHARAFVGEIHQNLMKSVAIEERLEWKADQVPKVPLDDTIIYETHVRGLTQDESSGVEHRGTYRGLIEKIPHLKNLGITAVELLPINEFGETYLGRCSVVSGEELINYWGYSNIGFFAPAQRYACTAVTRAHVDEFREMVDALHEAGIEVILDVVFNHTSEGNEQGPTLCFRGLDNAIYYMLDDNGAYLNFSGCGNTLHCDHPLVRDFILDCLRYWVSLMHIDGFRFDLASILGRRHDGHLREEAPLVQRISEDPVLRDVKLIAEAWDAAGAYQVGSFGGPRWSEWNGKYRDEVRQYWRGDPGSHANFATRLTGSADLYQWGNRTPHHSVNFVTAHDGFTLRDFVSYKKKHNLANGEGNRDGSNHNFSMNFGVEGETDDEKINTLRLRMQKNLLGTLFLSMGTPMMLGGDEFGRTQQGNNNAYCQDNEISWYDWSLLDRYQELHRFCKEAIAFRKANSACRRMSYYEGLQPDVEPEDADLLWFNEKGGHVDWHGKKTLLACRVHPFANDGAALYLMFNNTGRASRFTLPDGVWAVRIDTAKPAPADIVREEEATETAEKVYTVRERSLVVLSQRPNHG